MSDVHPCEAQSEMRANAGSDEQLACDERGCYKILPGNVIAGELTSIFYLRSTKQSHKIRLMLPQIYNDTYSGASQLLKRLTCPVYQLS